MEAIITIKNYRCFSDERPLQFHLKPGFIAIVGPNNAGKSTLLKFFYEFRNMWSVASDIYQLNTVIQSHSDINFAHLGTGHNSDIFSDFNNRNIDIEIKFINANNKEIQKASFAILREKPNFAKLSLVSNNNNIEYDSRNHIQNHNELIVFQGPKIPSRYYSVDINNFVDMMKILSKIIYIGAFRNALNEGSGEDNDVYIGTSLISTWDNWKTGIEKQQNLQIQKVTEDIQNIFSYNSLEINASSNKKTLQIVIDRRPYTLKEVGAGIAQFIIVFANVAIKKPSYILIDEPELNLHPQLQIDFLNSLRSYASEGIIYSTHSIGLARSTADEIYSIQKTKNHSELKIYFRYRLVTLSPNSLLTDERDIASISGLISDHRRK